MRALAKMWVVTAVLFPLGLGAAEPPAEPAADPAAAADIAEAEDPLHKEIRETLTTAYELVQKHKWKDYKVLLHPAALKSIDERNKRLKRDDHNLSFWSHIKEWKLQTWNLTDVSAGPRRTAVASVAEDRFLIEEKGVDEGLKVEWLLVRNTEGATPAWLILDRRNGASNFTSTSIEKGFADVLPPDDGKSEGGHLGPKEVYVKQLETAVRSHFTVPSGIPAPQLRRTWVILTLMLDKNGKVQSRNISRPSGNPEFDRAIIHAVDESEFPAPERALISDARKGLEITFKAKP